MFVQEAEHVGTLKASGLVGVLDEDLQGLVGRLLEHPLRVVENERQVNVTESLQVTDSVLHAS